MSAISISHQLFDGSETRPTYTADKLKEYLKIARELLKLNIYKILEKLEFDEWVSLIFLLYDEQYQYTVGFRHISDISSGKVQKVSEAVCRFLGSCSSYETAFDPLIEAFYHLGRYDILEDDLKLCMDHALHEVCQGLNCLFSENLALYQIFCRLTQEETDHLLTHRLKNWQWQSLDEMMELQFMRNLDLKRKTYLDLMGDLHEALLDEGWLALVDLIQPFIWKKTAFPEQIPSHSAGDVNEEDYYPMPLEEPHGLCVIINVDNFKEAKTSDTDFPLEARRGSDIDKNLVEGTFKLFGFRVVQLDNPDYEQFNSFFLNLRKDVRMYEMAALAVCVMTHGDREDNLYLADRTCIAVTDLRKLCYARGLIGKPKLFFIQACRGEENLTPMLLQRDATITSNTESDCLISQATVGNHSAMRSQSSGSWYISDLCSSLQELGHIKPLKTVLNSTRRKLMERVDKFRGMYITQISEDKDTLTKEVQLKRGEDSFLEGIIDLTQLKMFQELVECLVSEAVDEILLGIPCDSDHCLGEESFM